MDGLERFLKPHTLLIAQFAATFTLLQFLSGVFLLNDIRKKGSSNGFSTIPFLGGIVLTILSLKYGVMLRDDAMIKVNLFGFALNVIYISVYYFYTPGNKKTKIWGQIGLTGAICMGCIAYSEFEDPNFVEFRFGMLVTLFLIFLVGSPLLSIGEIVKTKSTKSLPLPIIISGTIVSFSWLLYGIVIRNSVLQVQNLILVVLSLFQLSLFLVYPREPTTNVKNQGKSKTQ